MTTVVLAADSVSKTYPGRKVLSAASISVSEGTVLGLVGRMGVGKSTLLKICAGLIASDSGWVSFAGTQYLHPRLYTLAARGMSYMPEQGNLVVGLSLQEHFKATQRRFGLGRSDEIIELLKLAPIMDSPPERMSGGEERRASIAVAMLRRPLCLLADDPFRSIDPILGERIGYCLRRMASEGCAVIVTGHEFALLSGYLDSVAWVTNGTTYRLGTVKQALANQRFCKEYLGPELSPGTKTGQLGTDHFSASSGTESGT
jgi:lipopolysaccharide export system ATP-binding protein